MDKIDSKRDQRSGCPVLAFQRMVSGKYKIRILWDLKEGARRYGEIRSGLLRGGDGSAAIAPRVLSQVAVRYELPRSCPIEFSAVHPERKLSVAAGSGPRAWPHRP